VTVLPEALVASTMVFPGTIGMGGVTSFGPVTFTVKVVCDWFFALSTAVQVTWVLPTGNELPDGGVQTGVTHGPEAGAHAGVAEAEEEQST